MNLHHRAALSWVADKTLRVMRHEFETITPERPTPHRPSSDQWLALADLVKHFDMLARGEADPFVYLSSLDPGIGKTTALIKYLDVLLSIPTEPYASCGVLIAMNTHDEIKRFVKEAAIPAEMLAVWTGKEEYNALGKARL